MGLNDNERGPVGRTKQMEAQNMKTGKSIVELAQELQSRMESKKDFVSDTRNLEMIPSGSSSNPTAAPVLAVKDQGFYSPTNHTHGQIASRLSIPKVYYDRMLDQSPELLARNVNHWFNEKPETRMLRTMGSNARAFLSNRYRLIENEEIAATVFPVLSDIGDVKIASCDVTDSRLYIKALFPKIEGEVSVGDVVQAGVVVSNSEIGLGRCLVQFLIYRLVCKNGMISPDHSLKKLHVGRAIDAGSAAIEFFKDDTLAADDAAFQLKVRDAVAGMANQAKFAAVLEDLREAAEDKIEGSPIKAVEVVKSRFALNEDEKDSVLTHLLGDGDLSKWGMTNALTAASQDVEDYDRATELEALGGKVIDLSPADWKEIKFAA
jgi:hypothetical protein